MTKYVRNLVNQLKRRKGGIEKNAALWENLPVNAATIDPDIAQLESIDKEIDDALALVKNLRANAKILVLKKKSTITKIDNLVYGIHNENLEKLSDYGIATRKKAAAKPVPTKGMIKNINDDYDNEGFLLERDTIVYSDNYEWQKAVGDDPSITNIDERKFFHFRITKKQVFVDDVVQKGVRYFYRFRGFNPSGNAPWSEPVSRVQ